SFVYSNYSKTTAQQETSVEQLFDTIISNEVYLLIAGVLVIALVFFVVKKMIKLLLYAFLILAAFLAYVFYSGKTVSEAVKPVQEKIEKAEKTVKENKEIQEVKKKVEKELKK
ncbi:MAG: hypothetical protein WCT99_12990, partial [Bacteroidota bacterium]